MKTASVIAAALLGWLPSLAYGQAPSPWPDSFVTRLSALALMERLNAEILGSRSATLTLETWCRDHALAAEPRIAARLVKGADKALTAEQRQRLQITDEQVTYRKVELQCGGNTLSEAENWYLPSRLTADMNRLLETTDTPFGRSMREPSPVATVMVAP